MRRRYSGVYAIICVTTRKLYVGSSVDIAERWREHRRDLDNKIHRNRLLQNHWNKYGASTFEWRVLELVEPERLIETEQEFIDTYRGINARFVMNLSPTAGSCLGLKQSYEERMNKSVRQQGRVFSAEWRAKISAALRGNKHNLGRIPSAETRAKLSAAATGRKLSAEAKAKLTVRKLSAETRAKVSAAMTGRKLSAETRAKISAANHRRYAAARSTSR
jgi:group I intron endonuclease